MKYNLIATDELQNITVFVDGEMYVATGDHPNWSRIVEMTVANDESVVNLFDASKEIAEQFDKLSERVSVANGRVYFDHDECHNAVTDHIVRMLDGSASVDFSPVVNFLEKVMNNPLEHSREQLWRWLEQRDFTLTDDGDIVAYKGVKAINGEYFSIHHGKAIVDGKLVDGAIPNAIGSVIEMPRADVEHNPASGCSYGLHAGTYEYAKSFGHGHLLQVHINPRDVVSVPTDCEDQKMRVCRYTVVNTIEDKINIPVWSDEYKWRQDAEDEFWDEDEYEEDMLDDSDDDEGDATAPVQDNTTLNSVTPQTVAGNKTWVFKNSGYDANNNYNPYQGF